MMLVMVSIMVVPWLFLVAAPPKEAPFGAAPARPAPKPFAQLETLGQSVGDGQVRVSDGKLSVMCNLPSLPADMVLLLGVPKTWPSKPPIYARLSFEFPYKGHLRARSITIETNLPAVAPTANVDGEFRRRYKPRSNLLLEYELLASTREPGEQKPLTIAFLARARLVRLYDDGYLHYSAGPGELGHTWLTGTPVYAPSGMASKEVGRIEARVAHLYPWSYVLLDVPKEAEAWFLSGYVRGDEDAEPRILCLARGCYEEAPMCWGQDELRRRLNPKPRATVSLGSS